MTATDAERRAMLAAIGAYAGSPPHDALTHGLFNDPGRGTAVLAALGDVDADAAERALRADPERVALLGRLCRYEAIVLQALVVASRKGAHPDLGVRLPVAERLLTVAATEPVGLPAADLAAMVAAAMLAHGDPDPERIVAVTALEVDAAREVLDPARLDRATTNHAAALDAAGRPEAGLTALRGRLLGVPDATDAVHTAMTALRAGRPGLAEEALRAGLAAAADRREELAMLLALSQLVLTERGHDEQPLAWLARAGALLDAHPAWRPDHALLAVVADPGEPAEDGRAVARILAAALGDPDARGRVCDRWVRLASRHRIAPRVHAAVLANLDAQRDASPHVAAWVVVQGFLTVRGLDARDPRLPALSAQADAVTGARWGFGQWTPSGPGHP